MKILRSLPFLCFFWLFSIGVNAQEAKPLVVDMLKAAVAGNEPKILELKARIDLLPKPEKGDRKSARALNDEALKKFQAEDFTAAASIFERAMQIDKSDVEIANNFGYALLKAKKYSEAKDAIFSALTLSPGRSGAWFNLAQAYGETGDKPNAIGAFGLAYTFSQNKEKTKEFLLKTVNDNGASATLVAAASEALKHEGIASSLVQSSANQTTDQQPSAATAPTPPVPVTTPPEPQKVEPQQTSTEPTNQNQASVVSTQPSPSSKATSNSGGFQMSANFPLIISGLVILGLGIFVMTTFTKNKPTDQQMDDWINEDLSATKLKALKKIGVDSSELVHEQIVIVGPRIEGTGGADFLIQKGKDNVVRYSLLNVTILNMTENQLIAYNCCLDITTGNQLQESTDEYFYRDVVSVSTKTSSFTMKFAKAAKLPGGATVDQMQFNSGEKFVLATSGGTSIEVFLKDDQWQQQLGGQIWTLDVEKAVQAVRKMLREKKV